MQETEKNISIEQFKEFSEKINKRIDNLENKIITLDEDIKREISSMKTDIEFDVKMLRVELDMKYETIKTGNNFNDMNSKKIRDLLDEYRGLVKEINRNLEENKNERGS